ncbi:class I SAM-dependent methyltransferase [Oryzibacter oryziterrae]|uniref:class I SAM-dependent methyltransferase n=1 Tax=Oryzibacter oryziterrae TaxID=2766474 RepID=UPI001F18D80D|nr:class I SAM-dependent methyltransferase [Oryzibacter oryziterrae]
MGRIKGEQVELSAEAVSDFFEKRAQAFDPAKPLSAVLYQDDHPEIARERDRIERDKITPLLKLTGKERLLDVGCGIGRWAQALSDQLAFAYGVDASPSLIELARKLCPQANLAFDAYGVDDLDDALLTAKGPFDRVILSGILIYLNDTQVSRLLHLLGRHLAPGGLLYLREPMGVMGRLSLLDHWSDELKASYNAIYREPKELESVMASAFPGPDFEIGSFQPLYDNAALNNRVETQQQFCIVRRRGEAM